MDGVRVATGVLTNICGCFSPHGNTAILAKESLPVL